MSNQLNIQNRDAIRQLFGEIADRYDLMNRIMTFGQDLRWRRQAAELARVGPSNHVLDVATGTGDMAFELSSRVAPGGTVIGIDFTEQMLALAREKAARGSLPVDFQLGDLLHLPFADRSFDAVTCAFGLRNVEDRQAALIELMRVIRPGKRVVILELTPPENRLARLYMDEAVPRLGQLIARARAAYEYLPESAQAFPDAVALGKMMQRAGLRRVTYRLLNVGTIAIHWGEK